MSQSIEAIVPQHVERSRFAEIRDAASEYGLKALACGAAIGAFAIAGCGGRNSEGIVDAGLTASSTANAEQLNQICAETSVANTAGKNYADGKFFASTNSPLTNANEAVAITKAWFEDNGPLANKADAGSLAIIDALVATQFNSKDTNNDYNPRRVFHNDLRKMNNEQTGDDTAKEICKDDYDAIASTVGYDEIAKGERYVVYTAVNGGPDNRILGYLTEQHTATSTFSVISFRAQNQKNQEGNGFPPVMVRADGTVLSPGQLPTTGANKQDKAGQAGNNKQQQAAANQGGGRPVNPNRGGNSQTEQNTNSGPKESAPNGAIPGPHKGPAKGTPGKGTAQPGPGPSPSGGGTTPKQPTETTPGTTPTPPAETTPTTPQSPPQETTPSSPPPPPPKGPEPAPVCNPPYETEGC